MFLDIALGIFTALMIIGKGNPRDHVMIIALGVLFALLPDFDVVMNLWKHTASNQSHTHREYLHMPMPYILLGSIMAWVLSGSRDIVMLFVACSLLHFLHDSVGIGWGVRWFAPFSKSQYAFLYHYDMIRNGFGFKVIYTWTPQDVVVVSARYGDPNWKRNIYLRLHPYGLMEYLSLVISLFICWLRMR